MRTNRVMACMCNVRRSRLQGFFEAVRCWAGSYSKYRWIEAKIRSALREVGRISYPLKFQFINIKPFKSPKKLPAEEEVKRPIHIYALPHINAPYDMYSGAIL